MWETNKKTPRIYVCIVLAYNNVLHLLSPHRFMYSGVCVLVRHSGVLPVLQPKYTTQCQVCWETPVILFRAKTATDKELHTLQRVLQETLILCSMVPVFKGYSLVVTFKDRQVPKTYSEITLNWLNQ